jgi:dihydrofolate synthase/folylpolyglutamate synthase
MEILGESPLVLLDGGHNPDAVQRLAEMLDKYLAGRSITAVMGIFKDKDYNAVIPVIASRAECFIAVRPKNPRALEPELLAGVAAAYCRETCWFEDLGEAYASALKRAGASGAVVICGSFYLAGPMRRIVLSNSKICQKET